MRAARLGFPIMCLLMFCTPSADAGDIITYMTTPQYNSYLAQAEKWRGLLARDEGNFFPAFSGAGIFNGSYVIIFRFQPPGTTSINFYGRHFSVLFDSKSDLIGMLRVKPEWTKMDRPDQKRAAATAILFIRRFTPALWRYTKSQIVKARDMEVIREDGQEATIKGVLSVFYDDRRETYFFVMIAPDGTVMAFERNLPDGAIDFGLAGRNWLYDSYLRDALEKSKDARTNGDGLSAP